MGALALILTAAMLVPPATLPCAKEAKLSALVVEVRSADYRGDRAALARLDQMLGELDDERLAEYRDYWRGFARWRRAQNGFNETPTPADLVADLDLAVGHFKASLARRPDWVEAKLAMVGCWGNLVYLAGGDTEKKKAILAELLPACNTIILDEAHQLPDTDHRRHAVRGAAALRGRHFQGRGHLAAGCRSVLAGGQWRAGAPRLVSFLGRTREPDEPRLHVLPRPDTRSGRGARVRRGRDHRGARVALRARHPAAADRGPSGGRCRPMS